MSRSEFIRPDCGGQSAGEMNVLKCVYKFFARVAEHVSLSAGNLFEKKCWVFPCECCH